MNHKLEQIKDDGSNGGKVSSQYAFKTPTILKRYTRSIDPVDSLVGMGDLLLKLCYGILGTIGVIYTLFAYKEYKEKHASEDDTLFDMLKKVFYGVKK